MRKPFFCICENKDADQLRNNFSDHLTAVTGVGSSPTLATSETNQVLLAWMWCKVVFPGYSDFAPPTDWLVSI